MATKEQPTKKEMYEFKRSILSFIRQNPNATRRDIAKGVGQNFKRVANAMGDIESKGMVHTKVTAGRVIEYRNTREAFKLLAEQYGFRRDYEQTNDDEPSKKAKESTESTPKKKLVAVADGVNVVVVPSKIALTIDGVQRNMDFSKARLLYKKLKEIPGIDE